MPEDELDLELQDNAVEKRIRSLNEKVKLTAQERDDKDSLLKERDNTIASLSKEKDFYASFSDSTAKYPNANEYKDKIREKTKEYREKNKDKINEKERQRYLENKNNKLLL